MEEKEEEEEEKEEEEEEKKKEEKKKEEKKKEEKKKEEKEKEEKEEKKDSCRLIYHPLMLTFAILNSKNAPTDLAIQFDIICLTLFGQYSSSKPLNSRCVYKQTQT